MSALLGNIEPRLYTQPLRPITAKTSGGFALCKWADENLDIKLLPHQRFLFQHALEYTPRTKNYRYKTVLVTMGRQNAKTTTSEVLALWRMLEDNAKLVVSTSVKLDTAREMFLATTNLLEESENLKPKLDQVRRANGQESLTFKNKARFKIAPANRGGARGLSCDLIILDEIGEWDTFEPWSATSKTTTAKGPKAQRWCFSTGGSDASVVLNHLRAAALAGDDPSLAIFEWSALPDADLDDPIAWQSANPAMGRGVPPLFEEDTIAADLATDPPTIFRTERLNTRVVALAALFDMGAWASSTDTSLNLTSTRDRVCLGIDISPDLNHVTATAATSYKGSTRVEVVGSWDSPQEARKALPDLVKAIKPRLLGYQPGPVAGVLGSDLSSYRPTALTHTQVAQACAGLVEQVSSRRILHNGDPLLHSHIAAAERQPVGNGFKFARKTGDLDAAYSCAVAVHLARSLPEHQIQLF